MNRQLSLPDGRVAHLRPATIEDAPGLVALDRDVAEAGWGVVITPAQARDIPATRAMLEDKAARTAKGELDATLVAEVDGQIVADGTLSQLGPVLCRHVAILAVGVHPRAQRMGIGRAILHGLIEQGRAAGILRIELYVRADNDRARPLYRSVGFSDECVRRRFVRLPDGTFVDDVVMVLFLDGAQAGSK